MLPLFALALLVGAALLFVLQPMVAKMVLPLFGGAPAVWNTCMVFFQAALLAGYAYAHWAPRRLGPRPHAILHLGLMLLAALLLPITITEAWAPPESVPPALWLLWLLAATVGVPFFVVSATAPLVQRWFAASGHASARDPYFLYAASNIGSMVALLSYPVLVEPTLGLSQQSWGWLAGYGLLVALIAGCALFLWRGAGPQQGGASPPTAVAEPVTWLRRCHWLALAFVPSSLMLSVTTYITSDIGAFPLFWVLPLALYLLTFILAFAKRPPVPHRVILRILPLVAVLLALLLLSEATTLVAFGIWPLLVLHLTGLFVIGMACHGELARRRPDAAHLTEFYLWLSVGGVLGGAFNALLAPVLFSTGVAEYPLVLILACLLRPSPFGKRPLKAAEKKPVQPPAKKPQPNAAKRSNGRQPPQPRPMPAIASALKSSPTLQSFLRRDLLPAVLLGLLTLLLVLIGQAYLRPTSTQSYQLMVGLCFGVPAVICYTFLERPLRFGLGIAALFFAGLFTQGIHGNRLYAERSFFGIHRVTYDPVGHCNCLIHGNTIHGKQSTRIGQEDEPSTYYYRAGPVGSLFATLHKDDARLQDVGVVGLGVGALTVYSRPGESWTYYEIDPVVVRIARDLGYFTYWKHAEERGVDLSVVLGDGRLKLQEADRRFDLLVVDVFNSDAVPIHLLTREAMRVYVSRLRDDGLLAFHVSNRYLDLMPVLSELAHEADLSCLSWYASPSEQGKLEGHDPTHWVVIGRSASLLQKLKARGGWQRQTDADGRYLWTDQFSNIISVIRWTEPE